MRVLSFLFLFILIFQTTCIPSQGRPGESANDVLKRFGLEGTQPFSKDDYVAYKSSDLKFISKPTVFLKLGAKGIVLEENFLFDKNTVHEKDVERAKNDSRPTVSIPYDSYLIGDFSQLPREQFDIKSRTLGAIAAPFGATVGVVTGAGKGLYEGTRIGVKTANSASKALGGDGSGKASAWASSACAVATGAVTGLFGGLSGGAVEGSVRGARVALEGFSGADREITDVTQLDSSYVIIGGRIGKELTPDEQRKLLEDLSQLEAARLAGGATGLPTETAEAPTDKSFLKDLDSAKDKSGFNEEKETYLPEDSENKNVAGMW